MTVKSKLLLQEATFRAFGSNCRVVCDLEQSIPFAISRLEDLESRWSRFRETSEVSEVNRRAGEWCEVSVITSKLFTAGVRAAELTKGIVNPLMLRQLEDLGYWHTHEGLTLSTAEPTGHGHGQPASDQSIEVDSGAVRIPAGTGFDPGGFGKGFAADIVAQDLLEQGALWVMVCLGGDIRFAGPAVTQSTPVVHVDDPRTFATLLGSTRVAGGALATSSTTGRRWTIDGEVNHHLLDPATGSPTQSPRIAATAYAPNAWLADVIAKTLVINPSFGSDELNALGAEAIAFTNTEVVDLGLPIEALPIHAKAAS